MGRVIFQRLSDDTPTPFDRPGISAWLSDRLPEQQPAPETPREQPEPPRSDSATEGEPRSPTT